MTDKAIYLTEAEVSELLSMDLALEALEDVFRARSGGAVPNLPRRRLPLGRGSYNLMAAAWPERGVVGHKSYAAGRGGATFHVMLYGTNGEGLLAVIEASRMGQVRTGAASGIATRYMARQDARTVGIIGSGYQAETQLEAIAAVRNLAGARVYSRNQERREAFAEKMTERLGLDVTPAESKEEAADSADILVAITSSVEPVITGEMVAAGVHVNAAGNNSWMKRELDTAAVAKADLVATDDIDQAKVECGELMRAAETGQFSWESIVRLDRIVAGLRSGRDSDDDITLFESQGVAFEDVAVCERLYRMAIENGVGTRLPG